MLNFDTMTNFDEIRNKYCCFWCLDLDIFNNNLSLFKPWLKFQTRQMDSIYVEIWYDKFKWILFLN